MQRYNLLLDTDSYKASHYLQYPPHAQFVSSYIESRGGEWTELLFFGLQAYLKEYLNRPITQEDIDEAEEVFTAHGLTFNRAGWQHILNKHGGRLPLRIQAVREGTVLPTHNVLVQVMNTDPEVPWLTSYMETAILRAIWYPTTVATQSWQIKQVILRYLDETSETPNEQIAFKLHDFGFRGVSSLESGCIGGAAHLVNFMGTDTVGALVQARRYYGETMAGFSIPAAEHSTITAWGKSHEVDAFRNMLTQFGGKGPLVAVVSDSYDIWNAVDNLWGDKLHDEVLKCGSTLVVRPDSGDPLVVPVEVIKKLAVKFGCEVNAKGYKVLNPKIRVIQGDGVNEHSIAGILENLKQDGWSADNIAFGMGGALLQSVNRDTLKFAMKASAIKLDGMWEDVFKQPITDPGKDSKKGRLALINDAGWKTIREDSLVRPDQNKLDTVWENGKLLRTQTFAEIRQLSNSHR